MLIYAVRQVVRHSTKQEIRRGQEHPIPSPEFKFKRIRIKEFKRKSEKFTIIFFNKRERQE